jgi:hypothetical protein
MAPTIMTDDLAALSLLIEPFWAGTVAEGVTIVHDVKTCGPIVEVEFVDNELVDKERSIVIVVVVVVVEKDEEVMVMALVVVMVSCKKGEEPRGSEGGAEWKGGGGGGVVIAELGVYSM